MLQIHFTGARDNLALPNLTQTIVIMPFTQVEMARRTATQLASRAGTQGLLLALYDDNAEGFVSVANRAFRSSSHPFAAYVAQDAFAGRDWLAKGIRAMTSKNGGLLAFNDGKWGGQLAAFGLARRDWIAGLYGGDLFYSGYESHYADAELTLLAMTDRRLVYDPNSVMVEVDHSKERRSVNSRDRGLFKARKADGFGGRVTSPALLGMFG